MNIKDMVKDNKQVYFQYYREGNLYYQTEDGFEFPVPISDLGSATAHKQDKAMLYMRYIRQHMNALNEGQAQTG